MSGELGVWSLLSNEAGDGSVSPGFAVVVTEVRWARWLLGEVEVGGSVSGEGLVGDLMWSLHVSEWVINPGGVNDQSRWSWLVRDLDSGGSGNESEEFHN